MARYWSINTAATAVALSAHPSPLAITTKLAAVILGGGLFGGGVLPAQYCPCGMDTVISPFQATLTLSGHAGTQGAVFRTQKTVSQPS